MRDLAARLRAIVQTDRKSTSGELTYVPDVGFCRSLDPADVAATLGGTVCEAHGGTCVVVDRTWTPDQFHGRRRVESYAIDHAAPIGLFDPRLIDRADWASRVVFFDI